MAACYCTFCGSYGHRPATCERRPGTECWPSQPAKAAVASAPTGPVLEVAGDDRAMRAFLYSKGLSIAGKTEGLRNRIGEWAEKNSYVTVEFK
jgi:hypothetical protein